MLVKQCWIFCNSFLSLGFALFIFGLPAFSGDSSMELSADARRFDEANLSAAEIYSKLTAPRFFEKTQVDREQATAKPALAGSIDSEEIVFDPDGYKYHEWSGSLVWGVSTAGTVKNSYQPPPPTLQKKSVRWNFLKSTSGGGFLFLEDGSALRFLFLRDGKLWLAGRLFEPRQRQSLFTISADLTSLPKLPSRVFDDLISRDWTLMDVRDQSHTVCPNFDRPIPHKLRFAKNGELVITEISASAQRGRLLHDLGPTPSSCKLGWSLKSYGELSPGLYDVSFFNLASGLSASYPGTDECAARVRIKPDQMEIEVHYGSKLSWYQTFSTRKH